MIEKVILGDCLVEMSQIEPGSIRILFADLPFGTTNAPWDIKIDLQAWWKEVNRIMMPNGVVLAKCQFPFTAELALSNLKNLRYDWVWEKTAATGHYNAKKMPMKAHETILVFYKKLPVYNPQKTEGHKPVNSFTKSIETQNNTELYGIGKKVIKGGGNTDRYPRSVLVYPSDKQKSKLHSTQTPVALLEYFIKTYSNEGDTVADVTAGSGSFGEAARNLKRGFVMIEKNPDKYASILKRLQL